MLPTVPARGARAIAGDSMGGYGAMDVALANPYRFGVVESWIGFFNGLEDKLRADRPIISRLGLHAFVYGGEQDHIANPDEDPPFAAALRADGADAARRGLSGRTQPRNRRSPSARHAAVRRARAARGPSARGYGTWRELSAVAARARSSGAGAASLGALALGAFAGGAVAIGALAIGAPGDPARRDRQARRRRSARRAPERRRAGRRAAPDTTVHARRLLRAAARGRLLAIARAMAERVHARRTDQSQTAGNHVRARHDWPVSQYDRRVGDDRGELSMATVGSDLERSCSSGARALAGRPAARALQAAARRCPVHWTESIENSRTRRASGR